MEPATKKSRPHDSEEKQVVSKIYRAKFKHANYNDYGTNTFFFTTGHLGSVVHLTDINLGYDSRQRLGKKIRFKSLQLHGVLYWGPVAPQYPLHGTLWIIWDRNPTGTLPAVSDILYPAGAQGFIEDSNTDRFRFLYRKSLTQSFTMQDPLAVDIYLDLKGCNSIYGPATNGLIANVESGALYLLTLGYEAPVLPYDQAMRLWASIRTRFINDP